MTVQVLLPGVLADLAGGSKHVDVEPPGGTLADVLDALAATHPMLAPADPRRDGPGAPVRQRLRRRRRRALRGRAATTVRDGAEVQVLPSVAGG